METAVSDREFLNHYHRSSYRSVQIAAIIGLVIYDLHLVWDYFYTPEHFRLFSFVRLGLLSPLILTMMAILRTDLGRRFQRLITLVTSLAATFGVMFIHFVSYSGALPTNATGIVLQVLFCLTTLRLLVVEAITYCILSMLALIIMLSIAQDTTAVVWVTNIVNLTVAGAIGVSASFLLEQFSRRSFLDEQRIRVEKMKAERLLENTFPIEIARRLKSESETIAEYSADVSVLFADIVGFTNASANMDPASLVQSLDEIFTVFDRLTAQHHCEKIKTIGDAYMAVSGVPDSAEDHAERVVRLALSMLEAAKHLQLKGEPLALRVGIHSGPVVAGVIGKTRFAYDLWGDTVNTASRMESSAPANGIQISEATYHLIKEKFTVARRGPIEIKGKGVMVTWSVHGANRESEVTSVDLSSIKAG